MQKFNCSQFFSQPVFRWLAVSILLFDYVLVSQGFIDGQGILFNTLNAAGSFILVINSLSLRPKDWAVAVFNIVWLGVGIITISKIIF